MHFCQKIVLALTALIFSSTAVSGLSTQAGTVITPPPPQPTLCSPLNPLKRQESCSYGLCGTQCLSQGAFCCGPAGTLATSPYWVCDNGACITSVRGSTGVVDCYDPDNPQGTTQSCIDNVPTATCSSTDRCYTCSTDEPFCFWETYVQTNPTTLRWFSCVPSKIPDVTFYAATITGNLSSSTRSPPLSTSSSTPGPKSSTGGPVLSTHTIISIAVGGGVTLIGCMAIIAWCCVLVRKKNQRNTQDGVYQNEPPPRMMHDRSPAELPVGSPPRYYDQQLPQMSQALGSTAFGAETVHDDVGVHTPVAELPGKTASAGVTGLGKYEQQEGERRVYEREIAYGNQNDVRATEQEPARAQGTDFVELSTNRGSYTEGDDWGHMSPGVGVAR
ncbi:uncharacterized protein BDZ99DRAFT_477219 [Mytilinidion resinicola]|uniref:Mid2 domain-containing protein n=1 Tax=Mytilinidion resinicola TaxID=574789 RepID=A0A6A6YJE9_9PEZI|nr:uncharacterized protein BDZ99DRAFT_477219 [Mytilinidion resinicola]KAF2808678.1 hypothetical protein BDZ99DRAFT_477219 [Mytilinidion resinicola]